MALTSTVESGWNPGTRTPVAVTSVVEFMVAMRTSEIRELPMESPERRL
jgi:hypothetical protein